MLTATFAAKQPVGQYNDNYAGGIKKTSLLLLVITAFVCSRTLFFFFHDPEGPNLLIVTVLALLLYTASWIAWRFIPATTAGKRLLFAICTQLLIVTGLYTVA